MEHDKMTFELLWNQEEMSGLQSRLRRDYPIWLSRYKRRCAVTMAVALLVVCFSVAILWTPFSSRRGCEAVCCNRPGFSDSHWTDMAVNILTLQTK